MSTNRLASIGCALILCLTGQVLANELACPINLKGASERVYGNQLETEWHVAVWPSTSVQVSDYTTDDNTVLRMEFTDYTQMWEEVILYRAPATLTLGKKALVFRVMGIGDNHLGQVWVRLRDPQYRIIGSVEITDHMITPPQNGWEYSPYVWYTVAIPIDAFQNDLGVDPTNALVREISFQAGDVGLIYVDDLWFVEGLEFPLRGYTSATAPISSVMDHTMTDGHGYIAPYQHDHVVTAYTGEVADGEEHSADSTCIARDVPLSTAMSNYDGASVCDLEAYLSYDGHPGIDYVVADVPVYPVADGVVLPGRCWTYNAGGTCTGWGAVGIDHGNGYITQYWHMKDIAVSEGIEVTTDTVLGTASDVGTPGAKHLHFEVARKAGETYIHVDPYGWKGVLPDPHRVKAVSVPLWK